MMIIVSLLPCQRARQLVGTGEAVIFFLYLYWFFVRVRVYEHPYPSFFFSGERAPFAAGHCKKRKLYII